MGRHYSSYDEALQECGLDSLSDTEGINLVWISWSLSWSLTSLVVGSHPREVLCTVEIWGTLTDLAFLGSTPPGAERALCCIWLICGTRLIKFLGAITFGILVTCICRHAIFILAVFTHNVIDSGEGWAVCLWYTNEWGVNMKSEGICWGVCRCAFRVRVDVCGWKGMCLLQVWGCGGCVCVCVCVCVGGWGCVCVCVCEWRGWWFDVGVFLVSVFYFSAIDLWYIVGNFMLLNIC